MFHWAPPDVNGFGVITSTPSFEQVVPGLDVLRVPGPDGEDDHGVRDHSVVVVLVPVRVDQARVDEGGHVGLEGEGDDVGRQPFLDGAPLLAGGCVGLLEVEALAVVGVSWKAGMISS